MNLLFVCSGNIFRSMSAEYLMRSYLEQHNIENILVSSAGTTAEKQDPFPWTVERLHELGCDPKNHIQRKLSKEILEQQDVVICMSKKHKDVVNSLGYGGDVYLFNKLAYGKNEDLMDDTEYGDMYGYDYNLSEFIYYIVDYIYKSIPRISEVLLKQNK